jgi:serine protease Do
LPGRTPYLGVRGDESATNARIASVVPDSPAERAGLKPGDVVLKFAGREITDFKSLTQAVQDQEPRRFRRNPIAIQIRRGEETMELQVQLGIRDE